MKKFLLSLTLLTLIMLSGISTNAMELLPHQHRGKTASNKTEATDCVSPTAQFDIDINNVRARLLTGGDMWWNFSDPKYEVPKGDGTGNPVCAIFAGAIWISGNDAGGNLKLAGQTYRASGDDYWPGPLTGGLVDKATCSKYDRFFNVYGADISIAQGNFLTKGNKTILADIPKGLLSWPAKGNQYLASDPSLIGETFNITDNLAPFFDADADGQYDPVKGDYPIIPCRNGLAKAYADQMTFWVFNDNGNIHTETNGQAIGVQINALAFAFQTTDDINNMTFYKYEIINKSAGDLKETYISQWIDPDLGCFNNDRVGCDTARSLAICYNGTTPDPLSNCNGEYGYGTELPLIGIDFFEGPLGDNGKQLGLTSFVYFTGQGAEACYSDPSSAIQFRNYQTGFWACGIPFTEGNSGHEGTVKTNFIFPGEPCDASAWSDHTSGLAVGDRRTVQTSGPFTLKKGEPQYVTVGVVFVQPAGGVAVPPCFSNTIGPADDKAQGLFNTCFKLLDGPDAPTLSIREMNNELIVNLINLPSSNNFGEGYDERDGNIINSVDTNYTFEGYKIYQVALPTVSATDLDNSEKAILVAEVDLKNGIKKVINFVKEGAFGGMLIPVLKVDGNDVGITNSFVITKDLFATGSETNLVNHKTYYFTAVAYAYNNFRPYDPANPSGNSQLTPYLQGRGNFKIYSAIPHISDPRNEGTVLNSKYGDGTDLKRIEGQGNGGNNLRLTPETIEKILSSGNSFSDTLQYERGYDPIGFKVTDPISLKEADFELQFVDTITNPIGKTSKWYLHDITKNDTIWGERTLDRPFEQYIVLNRNGERTDYGFSIKIGTPKPIDTIPGGYLAPPGSPNRFVYDAVSTYNSEKKTSIVSSGIEYQNPTEPWLTFLKDQGVNSVTNWIRSGKIANDPNSKNAVTKAVAGVFDDNWYYTDIQPSLDPPLYVRRTVDSLTDKNEVFENIAGGTWAPYCLTSNYTQKNLNAQQEQGGQPKFINQPGFRWLNYSPQTGVQKSLPPPQNTLDKVASVDIVITADKSKWTRSVVFETGEDEELNQGNDLFTRKSSPAYLKNKGAFKGQIRMAISKVWNDPNTRDFLVTDPLRADTGRSWFPGYAINVETGERLNIAFGESTDLSSPNEPNAQNGKDMLWNPTDQVYSPQYFPGQIVERVPFFGGKHFIYVMETRYDEGRSAQQLLLRTYDSIATLTPTSVIKLPQSLYPFYRSLMWTSIPYLTPGYSFQDDGGGNKIVPPSDVKIRLCVEKPINRMATSSSSGVDSLPRYSFSTKGLGAKEKQREIAKNALDLIRIVPNPYLAYSAYEVDQNTNRVKVTNLPNNCNITIFALDGTIIRKLSRAIDIDPSTSKKIEISDGNPVSDVNIENTIDWDLKNDKGIIISSGVYLFHIEAPGIGQRTLKWFGAVRPADASNF